MELIRRLWHAENKDFSAEEELRDFLRGFVRYSKPELVIETGCGHGGTAAVIAHALNRNDRGQLLTCDVEQNYVQETHALLDFLPASVRHCTGKAMIEGLGDSSVDMAFIDSGWTDIRIEEGIALKNKMKPVAWVFLHDVCNNYRGAFEKIKEVNGWDGAILPFGYGLGMFPIGQGTL